MSIVASRPRRSQSSPPASSRRCGPTSSRGKIAGGKRLPTESQLTRNLRRVAAPWCARRSPRLRPTGSSRRGRAPACSPSQQRLAAFGTASATANKISIALNVLEVRLGIEIESAGLAAQRRNPSQEAAIQEAFFEFDRLLSLDQATGKTDFAFHRAIAAATNNPFYVEVLDALGRRTIPCDVTSPWGTDSCADPRLPGGPAGRARAHPERDLGAANAPRRATPCGPISPTARSAIARACTSARPTTPHE